MNLEPAIQASKLAYRAAREVERDLRAEIPQVDLLDLSWAYSSAASVHSYALGLAIRDGKREIPPLGEYAKSAERRAYIAITVSLELLFPFVDKRNVAAENLLAGGVIDTFLDEIELYIEGNYPRDLYVGIDRWAKYPVERLIAFATANGWDRSQLRAETERLTKDIIEALPKVFPPDEMKVD
ncbi:MAG: hypothetical protein PHS44_06920 [Candidatus Dojkabacteria bacterium]|nr:hypothetical protein [Candidatus Dojkabacteria bacterium]